MRYALESLESRVLMTALPSLKAPHGKLPSVSQPPAYDGHVVVVKGVVNVYAPDPLDFGDTWKLDISTPDLALYGLDLKPSIEAIHQGQCADCYVLAAMGGMAISHPDTLKALIAFDGWGFAVTWTNPYNGSKLVVHTSATLSRAWQVQNGEAYWEVLEKTFCYFRTWNGATSQNTMASIGWGYPSVALAQVNDGPASQPYLAPLTGAQVLSLMATSLAAEKPVLFSTTYDAPSMVQSHVYTVYTVDLAAQTVTLWNPWGFFDTRSITDLLSNGDVFALSIGA